MMAMDMAIFVGLAILVLNIDATSSEPVVCSNNTRNLERGEHAVVSCEYSMDFIAVFWYKGEEETPFLRLEGGKNTTEEGFSIDSSGYMIIQNVQIANEGSYRISVLDSNGASTSATVNIFVKVSLKSNPQLERCSTSQHELCQTIDEEQRAGSLICYTAETRPAVNFRWSKLSSNVPVNVDELRSTSSMNSSTGLFRSSSVLSVYLNTFSLQYFTCSALGVAVMDERVTGEFIEGNNEDVPEYLGVGKVINQGEPLEISCSSESFQLRIWTFTHPDSPARIIKEFYPGQNGGPCLFGSKCSVDYRGVLLINETSSEDEGIYECTYGNGDTAEKLTTPVSIVISLKSNPQLERCSTSHHELCQTIDEEQRSGFLVCYTAETRPAVNFRWSKLSSNVPVNVDELRSTSSMNSSTGLFSSSSVLNVSLNTFSLQYFTCSALGVAVMDKRVTGEFIEGNNEAIPEHLGVDKVINQGEPLKVSCCEESFQLRNWKFTGSDSPARTIKEFYPGQKGGPCLVGSKCSVNDKGVLSIEETSYEDEGIYECTYGNGDTAEKLSTQVSIIIKPNPERIVIQGCADIKDCRRNVALTGKLEVYVTGTRPPVDLKCEVTEEANSHVFIFGDINNKIPNTDSGTFDTHYTANYKIDECSDPVHVVCNIQGDTIFSNVHPSHVYLVTDVSNCGKGRPGLFIVLLFVVAVAIIVIVLYKKRRTVRTYLSPWLGIESIPRVETKEACEEDGDAVPKIDEERGQGEGAHVENETTADEESSQPLLTDELTLLYQQFCTRLKEIKRVPETLFKNLMEKFQDHDQSTPPGKLLVNQMEQDDCNNEMLFIVLKYLAESNSKDYIPVLDLCKLLEDLTLSNKLSAGSSITILLMLLKKEKINLTTYVELTGKLLKSGKFDEVAIINNLKDLLSKGMISEEDLANSILQYVNSFKMNESKALEEVKALGKFENKVPYTFFLRGINRLYKLGSCGDVLLNLFDDIVKEFLSPKCLNVVQQRVSNDNEVISIVYLQVLLCSIFDRKMLLESATNLLNLGINKSEILQNDFVEAFKTCMQNDKISPELKHELPLISLHLLKGVASADYFEETLLQMINSEQVSADKFEEALLKGISSRKNNQTFWMKFILDLWKKGQVGEGVASSLTLKIAETYSMAKKDFNELLDKEEKSDLKKFMKSIKFDEKVKK